MIFFNTTGPVDASSHYLVPPLSRINLPEILRLISTGRYFVLHAPRQTGKTSTLLSLRDHLNSSGDYRCVYVNVEAAQTAREDIDSAMRTMLSEFAERAQDSGDNSYPDAIWPDLLERSGANSVFNLVLSRWAGCDQKPLVLLIDEIDALVGDTLVSVLRQLSSGYDRRPVRFPQSVVLCGVRDVRDYRIHTSSKKEVIAGGSAFNIKAKSLRLGDFTEAEMRALLLQHTEETGQAFAEEALSAIWEQTQGQPWLVNALAWEICFEGRDEPDYSDSITHEDVIAAREALILRHDTHLDQLTDKLQEDRVRRVVEPILAGRELSYSSSEDKKYIRDLGLVAQDAPLRIANPIYSEVIPRVLTDTVQDELSIEQSTYINDQGGLDMSRLIGDFQQFFRENSEIWVNRFSYSEAGCQLLLQAFLQRVIKGGGSIER
ncbi:MAG: AAA-like domain-containing protein [Albidovulum sp.]|nr:AAA-like domain-containing protein [Albidovulum sp.]